MSTASQSHNTNKQRLRVRIMGAVQGVGFRPFVYRTAEKLGLPGWVTNSSQGVTIEVEGKPAILENFLQRLKEERPPRSFIQSLESSYLDPACYSGFEIRPSVDDGEKTAFVLPDIGVCADCLADISDPGNRRYRYPFTNCTNCGPRYSIIEALPYDRQNTTMKAFEMCDACRAEYEDPLDRRFHAQPNACPACGPHLELLNKFGKMVTSRDDALRFAANAIRGCCIVAVKGLGGFHLMANARCDSIISELRRRKHREEKPLAVMFPTLSDIEDVCEVSDLERRLLTSPESPIVLLKRKAVGRKLEISELIAPGNPYIGAMLPYTPLHHLLLTEAGIPVVATSGNISDEPICIDETEATERLHDIADLFLVHDRPIVRHVDDSIVRVMMGREMVVRRARGFAPLPVSMPCELPPTLAVGAHLKNSVVLSAGRNAFISQHIGDLETGGAYGAFQRVIRSLEDLYEIKPGLVACDRHPDYLSTKWARLSTLPNVPVQHHYAHVLSCMADNDLKPPVLGIAWDGTGYGSDGTIWGGEFLRVTEDGFERVAHLRSFRLPGGDLAVKEPRRSATGLLYELFDGTLFDLPDLPPLSSFTPLEFSLVELMVRKGLNSPVTSSAGRLFDAVSSILGLCQRVGFEGQAAMALEYIADENEKIVYPFDIGPISQLAAIIDWGPAVKEIIADIENGVTPSIISARFHNSLVEMIVSAARRASENKVVLSGGCFQNRYLTELAITRLREEGFKVYWHQRVPTNDGGIALGQAAATANRKQLSKSEEVSALCA